MSKDFKDMTIAEFQEEYDIEIMDPKVFTREQVKDPESLVKQIQAKNFHLSNIEKFMVVTLSGDNKPINFHEITKGTVNKALVHPRDVFRAAIKDNAVSIIVAHNHPSGNLTASTEDKRITAQLVRAGEVLGIPVLDHLIVSAVGSVSLKQDFGYLFNITTEE